MALSFKIFKDIKIASKSRFTKKDGPKKLLKKVNLLKKLGVPYNIFLLYHNLLFWVVLLFECFIE